jgi:glycosyltransferase involved in cell wall biosynthesis
MRARRMPSLFVSGASLARPPGQGRPGLPGSRWFILLRVTLSVVLITYNEEVNLARTLESVRPLVRDGQGEIIVVDSGSIDRTLEIANSYDAKVFIEPWKGYAAQKNSAIEKATGDWILNLDADEEVGPNFAKLIPLLTSKPEGLTEIELANLERSLGGASLDTVELVMAYEEAHGASRKERQAVAVGLSGYWIARENHFLGRWIKHGGFWPDPKLRLFRRGHGRLEERAVHETVKIDGYATKLNRAALIHHSYPTLFDYIDHMNRYSSLGAKMVVAQKRSGFSVVDIGMRPLATFVYNYFLRLGFLDGREGLLLHLYHAVYVSWKYAKAWELGQARPDSSAANGASEGKKGEPSWHQ